MENPELYLAEQFALYTNRSFFLTGKAGTGKTTLLKRIVQHSKKQMIVVAPTGVAAINAGGVTIHSQFNLPLTAFVPNSDWVDMNRFTNRRALVEHIKFRKEKRRVIQEAELLIIDEVSMVRADLLDAVDFVMRTVRRNQEPFGGTQVMLIGDMHQLPPIVKEPEWETLKQYYDSPYFFDSLVWKQMDAAEIELKQVFRQSDERFIELLNHIRHLQLDENDYEQLQSRYRPDFKPKEQGYILLSTHNHTANLINETELKRVAGPLYEYEAEIEGDFPEHIYPCEKMLRLKKGAQVMFTRNDTEGGKYYNGKIAVVSKLDDENITVAFENDGPEFTLHKEVWENISYTVNESDDTIHKNTLGTFSQFPLRLAWAITIHKSQGLTFDKVIIDAGKSFAPGQVYVALSRCRSLEGIILHSLITAKVLFGDQQILAFSEGHHSAGELSKLLDVAKREYAAGQLHRLFDLTKFYEKTGEWKEVLLAKEIPDKENTLMLFDQIIQSIDQLVTTSEKFAPQLERLLNAFHQDARHIATLKERCAQAIAYFTEQIFRSLIEPLHEHIVALAYKSRVKQYVQYAQAVEDGYWKKIQQMYEAQFMEEVLFSGHKLYDKTQLKSIDTSVTTAKREKGGTYQDTLKLYRQGKSTNEIAEIRSLAVSTIKGHFARWILQGEIDLYGVLPVETIEPLLHFFDGNEEKTVSTALRKFGSKYDGNEVRMVLNYWMREKASAKIKTDG